MLKIAVAILALLPNVSFADTAIECAIPQMSTTFTVSVTPQPNGKYTVVARSPIESSSTHVGTDMTCNFDAGNPSIFSCENPVIGWASGPDGLRHIEAFEYRGIERHYYDAPAPRPVQVRQGILMEVRKNGRTRIVNDRYHTPHMCRFSN